MGVYSNNLSQVDNDVSPNIELEVRNICKNFGKVVAVKNFKTLKQHKGIGMMTASTLYAEIVAIRRFVKDDNLASYAEGGELYKKLSKKTEVMFREKRGEIL